MRLAMVMLFCLVPATSQATPLIDFMFLPWAATVVDEASYWDDDDASAYSRLRGRGGSIQSTWLTGNSRLELTPSISANQFQIRAQASADGQGGGLLGLGWTDDGAVDFEFTWQVPYYHDRLVTIDLTGPVPMATFPVVTRGFQIRAVGNLVADTDFFAGKNGASAIASLPKLEAGGTDLETIVIFEDEKADSGSQLLWGGSLIDFGPTQVDNLTEIRLLKRSTWLAPDAGEIFTLRWDPLTGNLRQRDTSRPFFFVEGRLAAKSFGTNRENLHPDFWLTNTIYGGGEALACFGADSPLSTFYADCWDRSGIWVDGLFALDALLRIPVEFVEYAGLEQRWRVLSEASPPPAPMSGPSALIHVLSMLPVLAVLFRRSAST